ncbi:MAG: patatin-like phospholipase family protein [Nitrospira sp.]|nr:patatin-like phospholipase family protein [Nitrospira sp.]
MDTSTGSHESSENTALFLSGGGFRATFFHLGVIRFLKDSGQLPNIKHISAVSGGSILAAHLVLNWERYLKDEESFDKAVEELLNFARFDPRGRITRRFPFTLGVDLIFPGFRFSRSKRLEIFLSTKLYKNASLSSLRSNAEGEKRPELHLLATSLTTGNCCWFSERGLRVDQSNRHRTDEIKKFNYGSFPLSRAVAASAAFPPLFPPVVVKASELDASEDEFPYGEESLTDGGVFDNLGLRHLQWLEKRETNKEGPFSHIICSDATTAFRWKTKFRIVWLPARAARASNVMMKRIADLEYEQYKENNKILRLSIDEEVYREHYIHALPIDLQRKARNLRTDLDYFSDLEICTLIAHGYEVAYKKATESKLVTQQDETRLPWVPCDHIEKIPYSGPQI